MAIYSLQSVLIVSVALAVLLVLCVRANIRVRWFVGGLVLAIVSVALVTSDVTCWGFHGQMHWAFSLGTLRSFPPEDPTFAGEALTYPWAAHWFYGHLGKALAVSPLSILAASDALWLAIMLLAAARATFVITGDKAASLVSALLCWTGVLVTDNTYIGALSRMSNAIRPCMRMVPADKFFNPNNNPIGLALAAVAIMCVVETMSRPRIAWRWLALLLAAAFGCAAMYPISYLGLVVGMGGAGITACIVHRTLLPAAAWACTLAIAAAGALALPLMYQMSAGRGPDAQMSLTSPPEIAARLAQFFAIAWPVIVLLLAFSFRRNAAPACRTPQAPAALLGWSVGLSAAYLAITIPLNCEYKFLAHTAAPMACLLGGPIASWARRKPWLAVAALVPLCLGAADRELVRFALDWKPSVRVTHGEARAEDRGADAVLTFLRERTPIDAVVISEDALVPIAGERSLFLLPGWVGTRDGDGWSMPRWKVALCVVGHSREALAEREKIQMGVLSPANEADHAAACTALRSMFPDRPVYVAIRGHVDTALRGGAHWKQEFAGPHGTVYRLTDAH